MGEEREDSQKIKRIAAAAYDYDNDPRWAEYWSNILIPPHMAARSDVVDHYKRKFYQRYIDPDLVVESMSQPTQASASSTSSATANDRPRQRNSANPGSTTSRSSGTSTNAGSNTTSVRWDRQTIQFSVNAWVM
ncbi:hypothetical protein KPL71_019143 [Citrus sinensis]|uniref:Uncharacterized protein n=1 Tax=Citrus sinensis TaxID=2711 RepID=A0ACB8K400_CITSI|nr:hypothetical protein KPL71_019143 [Citrus sinensis]